MELPEKSERLRIYIGENDKVDGRLVYERIVLLAREHGLAGATVLRGVLGYGANSRVHTSRILRLSEGLPVVVEIVDRTSGIESFLPLLDGLITEGLVTREEVQVLWYRHSGGR
jgi:hypothetical protein